MFKEIAQNAAYSGKKSSPPPGFGTYRLKGDICFQAVLKAAEAGYRLIDTAGYYDNFEPIGEALKRFRREDFYLVSKVWPGSHTSKRLSEDLHTTLRRLQTDYLDAYLLHWPDSNVPIEETLGEMHRLQKEGKIREIGFSNVTVNHLVRAAEVGVSFSCVQTEMHPFFYDPKLLEYCRRSCLTVQAWAPLNRGAVEKDPFLIDLGKKYRKTASQIALRWIMQHDCISLPGSKNPKHIKENFEVFDFRLTTEETATIDAQAEKGTRKRILKESGLGFLDEFDFSYSECWPKS